MDLKRIIVTMDLSENAAAALPIAAELSRRFGAKVYVVHVFEDLALYGGAEGIPFEVPEIAAALRDVRRRKLDATVKEFSTQVEIAPEAIMLEGEPAKSIVKFARELKVDCIVLATHGRTGLSRMFLGSVAEKVVRTAPCAVLTVRSALDVKHKEPADAIAGYSYW